MKTIGKQPSLLSNVNTAIKSLTKVKSKSVEKLGSDNTEHSSDVGDRRNMIDDLIQPSHAYMTETVSPSCVEDVFELAPSGDSAAQAGKVPLGPLDDFIQSVLAVQVKPTDSAADQFKGTLFQEPTGKLPVSVGAPTVVSVTVTDTTGKDSVTFITSEHTRTNDELLTEESGKQSSDSVASVSYTEENLIEADIEERVETIPDQSETELKAVVVETDNTLPTGESSLTDYLYNVLDNAGKPVSSHRSSWVGTLSKKPTPAKISGLVYVASAIPLSGI